RAGVPGGAAFRGAAAASPAGEPRRGAARRPEAPAAAAAAGVRGARGSADRNQARKSARPGRRRSGRPRRGRGRRAGRGRRGAPGGVVGGIVGGLPDAPAPVAPVRVGGSVREPRRLTAVAPVYPSLAQMARLQGTVVIEATVNERGHVVNASVLQGLPMLNDA